MSAATPMGRAGERLVLRPLSLGEILDRAFHIYRARLPVLVGISIFPATLILSIRLADVYWWHLSRRISGEPSLTPRGTAAMNLLVGLALYHISLVVHSVFTPGILKQASDFMFGEQGSLRSSLAFLARRWRSFLWIGILMLSFVLLAPELVTTGLLAGEGWAMDSIGPPNGGSPLLIAAVILVPLLALLTLFLWMLGCCAFAPAARAFEEVGGFKAIQRSWRLNRGGRWRVAMTWLMLLVAWTVVSWALQLGFRWASILAYRCWTAGHHFLIVTYLPASYVLFAAFSAVVVPVFPIAVTLFYYDQRIRKEGFDIEHLMRSTGMTMAGELTLSTPVNDGGEVGSAPAEEWDG